MDSQYVVCYRWCNPSTGSFCCRDILSKLPALRKASERRGEESRVRRPQFVFGVGRKDTFSRVIFLSGTIAPSPPIAPSLPEIDALTDYMICFRVACVCGIWCGRLTNGRLVCRNYAVLLKRNEQQHCLQYRTSFLLRTEHIKFLGLVNRLAADTGRPVLRIIYLTG